MQGICRKIRRVGHQNADGNFDRAIVDTLFDPVHDPSCNQTHGDTRDDQVGQAQHSIGRSRRFIFQEDADSKFEGQQPRGIIDQALPFQNVGNALGQTDALGDGSRGQRVRRRDHGPQYQADFPVKSGKQPRRAQCHSDHGKRDQPKSQKQNAGQVVGKVAPGRFPCGGVEKWRKDYVENDIRIQLDSWNSRNEAE